MTAPDPLEVAARRLEALLDLNGHTCDGIRRATSAAIQAYLRAEAEDRRYLAPNAIFLRWLAAELDPAPAEAAEQEME